MNCIICNSQAYSFFTDKKDSRNYFHCKNCDLRFLNPNLRINTEAEMARYLKHENSENDGYLDFVAPLLNAIKDKFGSAHLGLDFGCGKRAILEKKLSELGLNIDKYDYYFYPKSDYLKKNYDFIYAVEVIEHLHDPVKEMNTLYGILKEKGHLIFMTSLYSEQIDFENWYYRRDSTHICFYSKKTFEWIANNKLHMNLIIENNNLIWLEKK